MEPVPKSSSPSLMASDRVQGKGTTLLKVNKVLAKGMRQLFANQREPSAEVEERSQAGTGHSLHEKSSFLRSFMIPLDDELSVLTESQRTSIAEPSLRSNQKVVIQTSSDRWRRSASGFRRHFIPKMGRKSPVLSKRREETIREKQVQPQDDEVEEEEEEEEQEDSWPAPHHSLQAFKPPELLGTAKTQRNLHSSIKMNTQTMTEKFLGMDTDSIISVEEAKAKSKTRFGDSRRFSLYHRLPKIRSSKKEKVRVSLQCSLTTSTLTSREVFQILCLVASDGGVFLSLGSLPFQADAAEVTSLALPPSPPAFSVSETSEQLSDNSHVEEEVLLQELKTEQGLLQQKILKISEQIRVQQTHRNTNVSEYLRLIARTDHSQAFRLKQAFEKKNHYLTSVILQLQRRLQQYVRKQQQLERELELLREKNPSLFAIQGLRSDHLLEDNQTESPFHSEASSLSKANLLAHALSEIQGISKETPLDKFNPPYQTTHPLQQLSLPDDDYSITTSFSEDLQDLAGLNYDIKTSGMNSSDRQNTGYLSILEELTDIKETQLNLELSFKNIAEQYNQHYSVFQESLEEEKYRSTQLQAELNDLMDLHQNEVLNLKSELASLEEKIAYQSYESSRDIWEVLENFQSKMARLEQQQQAAQGEILDHVNTRELLGKTMNLLLIIIAVILMLMSTISAVVSPFIKTRARTISTGMVVVLLLFAWHNWELLTASITRRVIFRWR
ncbi:transmembrane and coiled-coil domain protein 3-like [Chiloscyllium punctatum]|uniref:transmembrane and coiled-coil domain protein 3-like n=1 Tax=Chiloscyllium punctatum TaxID=137246 RepID=UPI003B641EBB